MHICLATDIDVEALRKKKPTNNNISQYMSEHILCSIRLYRDGLLEVTPSFSRIADETISSQVLSVSGSQYFYAKHII